MIKRLSSLCGKQSHTKVCPSNKETIHFKNYDYKYDKKLTGYADFVDVLQYATNRLECP